MLIHSLLLGTLLKNFVAIRQLLLWFLFALLHGLLFLLVIHIGLLQNVAQVLLHLCPETLFALAQARIAALLRVQQTLVVGGLILLQFVRLEDCSLQLVLEEEHSVWVREELVLVKSIAD